MAASAGVSAVTSGVGGEAVGGYSRRTATYRAGRVCEQPGCRTVLSIYNSRRRCALHDFDSGLLRAPRTRRQAQPAVAVTPAEKEAAGKRSAGRPKPQRRSA